MEYEENIVEEIQGEIFQRFKTLGFGPQNLINKFQWSQAFPLLPDASLRKLTLHILDYQSLKPCCSFHYKIVGDGQPQTIRQFVHKMLLCPGIRNQIRQVRKEQELRELKMTKGDIFLSVYLRATGVSEQTIELLRINGVTQYQLLRKCRKHLKEIGIDKKDQQILKKL